MAPQLDRHLHFAHVPLGRQFWSPEFSLSCDPCLSNFLQGCYFSSQEKRKSNSPYTTTLQRGENSHELTKRFPLQAKLEVSLFIP